MNGEWAEAVKISISVLITCLVLSFGIYQMITGQFIATRADAKLESAYPSYDIELAELVGDSSDKNSYYGVQAVNIARKYSNRILVCVNTAAAIPSRPVYFDSPSSVPVNKRGTGVTSLYTNHNYTLAYFPANTANNGEAVLVLVDGGES